MFQKKEYIYSDSIGACLVEDIVKLSAQKNAAPILYYVLRSVADKKKVSYIPVENHKSLLRPLISEEQAQELLEAAKENGSMPNEEDTAAGNSLLEKDDPQKRLLQEAIFVLKRRKQQKESPEGSKK